MDCRRKGGNMFSLMLQKLLHKKWLVMCILIGNILLIGVVVSYPMYKEGSFQRMLTDDLERYWEEKEEWPAGFTVEESVLNGLAAAGMDEMGESISQMTDQVGIPVQEAITWYGTREVKATPGIIRDGVEQKTLRISAISNLEEHIELISGEKPRMEPAEDGFLEVMVSEKSMVYMDMLLGDEFEFPSITNQQTMQPLKIRVVGVYRAIDDSVLYWKNQEVNETSQVFVSVDAFRKTFTTGKTNAASAAMEAKWYVYWDYKQIRSDSVAECIKNWERKAADHGLGNKAEMKVFKGLISQYSIKTKQIGVTLSVLQIPVLLLVCAFLYMISSQMLQIEQNEIALIKSRGAAKLQIIRLYCMQSSFLALLSFVAGIPLGRGVAAFLGSATAFLEFGAKRSLEIHLTPMVFLYAGAAVLAAVAVTTLPVIKSSGISIVNLKQGKTKKKKSFWKKMYLDVVFLAISLYGLYSIGRNEESITETVLQGQTLDPLLYLSFSLFVLGCGLLVCRLQPILLKGIFKVLQKHLKPAAYASMLETIRTGHKQEFIILFMILTVAIGIFNTAVSRTILANAENNIFHIMGAQVSSQEVWKNNAPAFLAGRAGELVYYEPPYDRYLDGIPGVKQMTKVLRQNVKCQESTVELMAIEARDFAAVSKMKEGLLPFDYIEYLNVLVSDRTGFLVSQNFMDEKGNKLGDFLVLNTLDGKTISGYIRGFVPYWPGYEPKEYKDAGDGTVNVRDRYLVVANLPMVQNKIGTMPYEIWYQVNDEGKGLESWFEDQPEIVLSSYKNANELLDEQKEETLFQGTNGILSMSFIIILVLCCAGYLIYWIMAIRSRELLFGVLRAMGMRKKEIAWMLIIEQICSGLFAIVAGGCIGMLASCIFVPLIQKAFASTNQVLPLEFVVYITDLIQLFAVIGVMLCICMAVFRRIISEMNISKALKLGED